jgi:acetylornithine deacetylase/succinyl-diaminopimelate desuccinylase-like protein
MSLARVNRWAVTLIALATATFAHAQKDDLDDIFRTLVETNTAQPEANSTPAAQAMARRLLDAGFDAQDVQVIGPVPEKQNLVARLRGTGEMKPILLLAHLDVVAAHKEDWTGGLDPFHLTERDGYYYGRGTIDDKAMGAIFIANLVRMKKEGFRPRRDIIVALTADEEAGNHNGVAWLIQNHRDLIDADVALNEGGSGSWRSGKPFINNVQVSEKVYQSFTFEVTGPGGHSSVPGRTNVIYELGAALERLSQLEFPVHEDETTRRYFHSLAATESGTMAASLEAIAKGEFSEAQLKQVTNVPRLNAQLRTTCVATRIEGGHGDNALPQRAQATVNCRIFPGEKSVFIESELKRVAGDRVTVAPKREARPSQPSDPDSPFMKTIERVSESMWPGTPVVPVMSSGATDGSKLRNAGIPVYGVNGIFVEYGENRIHGQDERIPVRSLHEGREFLYRLAKALASGT